MFQRELIPPALRRQLQRLGLLPDPARAAERRRNAWRRRRRWRTGLKRRTQVTGEGLMFCGLGILIGLAAINTGTNLLYMLLAMLLAMLLVSLVLSVHNLSRIRVERRYPLEFHAGQEVAGILEVHNTRRLTAAYSLALIDFIEGPERGGEPPSLETLTAFAASIPPRSVGRCAVRLKLPRRGMYYLPCLRVASRFPFGFIDRSFRQDLAGRLMVYPRLLPEPYILKQVPGLTGDVTGERKGQGSGIFGVRAYREGDPIRHIHWKHSARGQGLMVKEFEQEQTRSFRLMLDLRRPHQAPPTIEQDLELAISVVATLARLLLRYECRVAMWTSRGNIPSGSSRPHLQRIMRALTQMESQDPGATPVPPEPLNPAEVEIWVEYSSTDDRAARFGSVLPRSPGCRVIDARRIGWGDDQSELTEAVGLDLKTTPRPPAGAIPG